MSQKQSRAKETMSVVSEAVGAVLIFAFGLLAWLLRRAVKQIQKEREMVAELYAAAFGAEEVGLDIDDKSFEEKLERDYERDRIIREGQERIVENQQEIVDCLGLDVDVRELPDDE